MRIPSLGYGRAAIALTVGLACLAVSDNLSVTDRTSFMSEAQAIRGRPLTPMSYAGVARRTTRRAGAVGAGAAVAYGAYGYYAPGCVQAVNAYGQIYTRC
jgi:hypothetical protein